jgi:hypothetical protein
LFVIVTRRIGQTKPLGHTVANMIASGIDPRRILLMIFSRWVASGCAAVGRKRPGRFWASV